MNLLLLVCLAQRLSSPGSLWSPSPGRWRVGAMANNGHSDGISAIRRKWCTVTTSPATLAAQDLLAWADTVEIVLTPPASYRQAWDLAEAHYACMFWNTRRALLSRGSVIAYLRHNCTNYESLLASIVDDPDATGQWEYTDDD